jgi:8-oxo-dGTP pyrophosphatase MutT (NUDIX family)
MKEDPLAAAKRELLEETGLLAKHWEKMLTLHLSNSVSDEFSVIYLARELEQQKPMPDETEALTIKKIPFAEALIMLESGAITDAMSVAAIQRVQLLLFQGKFKK